MGERQQISYSDVSKQLRAVGNNSMARLRESQNLRTLLITQSTPDMFATRSEYLQKKAQWLRNLERTDQRISRLQLQEMQRTLFTEALSLAVENPNGTTLSEMAQILQAYSPLPTRKFLDRGEKATGLSEEHLSSLSAVSQKLHGLSEFTTDPILQAYDHYIRYYLWRGNPNEEVSMLPSLKEFPFGTLPLQPISPIFSQLYSINLPLTNDLLRFSPSGAEPATGGYVTPIRSDTLAATSATWAAQLNPSLLYPGKHPETHELSLILSKWFESLVAAPDAEAKSFFFPNATTALQHALQNRRDYALQLGYSPEQLVVLAPPDTHEAVLKTGKVIGVPIVQEGIELGMDYRIDIDSYRRMLSQVLEEGKFPIATLASIASEKGLVSDARNIKRVTQEVFQAYNVPFDPFVIADIAPLFLETIANGEQGKIQLSPSTGADAVVWNFYQAGWGSGSMIMYAQDEWLHEARQTRRGATSNQLSDQSVTILASHLPVIMQDILSRGLEGVLQEKQEMHERATRTALRLLELGYDIPYLPETSTFLIKAPNDPTGRKTLALFNAINADKDSNGGARIRLSYSVTPLARTKEEVDHAVIRTGKIIQGRGRGDREDARYEMVHTPHLALWVTVREHETPQSLDKLVGYFARQAELLSDYDINQVLNQDIRRQDDSC